MIQTELVSKIKKLTDIKKLHPKVNLWQLASSSRMSKHKSKAFGKLSRRMKKVFWLVPLRLESIFKIYLISFATKLTTLIPTKIFLTSQQLPCQTQVAPWKLVLIEVISRSPLTQAKTKHLTMKKVPLAIFYQRSYPSRSLQFKKGLRSRWQTYLCSLTSWSNLKGGYHVARI